MISHLSMNQLHRPGYTFIFGCGKCSISSPLLTITAYHVNQLYFISATTTLASTSMPTQSTTRRRLRMREAISSSTYTNVPSIANSTKNTTCSLHTASQSTAWTVPQCQLPPNCQFPLTSHSQGQNRDSGIAAYPTSITPPFDLSLIDIPSITRCAPHASSPSARRRSLRSRPRVVQTHLNSSIWTCVNHSPHLPPLAITTISYSSMARHNTPPFGSSQIRCQKCAP